MIRRKLGGFRAGGKPPAGTPIDWSHPLAPGLLASYLMNEGHGRTLHDGVQGLDLVYDASAGTDPGWRGAPPDVNGQSSGPTFGVNPLFTGSPDRYVAPVNYPAIAQLTDAISVEFWMWGDTDTVGFPVPLVQGPVNTVWEFVKDGTSLIWRIGGGSDVADTVPFNPPKRWLHYVGTYDRKTQRIYRDGIERANLAASGTIPTTTSGKLAVGESTGGGNWFAGQIGLVRIWNRALGPDAVLELFNDPFGMYSSVDRGRSFSRARTYSYVGTGGMTLGGEAETLFTTMSLRHEWNVLREFQSDLLHEWNVRGGAFAQDLSHRWTVIEETFEGGLTHSWRVIPDVEGAFSEDVQMPVAAITKT